MEATATAQVAPPPRLRERYEQEVLPALMQRTPLTLDVIFERMRTVYADGRVIDAEGTTTYGEFAERVLRLARVLTDELGVRPGDRVASFGFNSTRHLELYYAVPLIGAVLHTVNVRLLDDQIAYIVGHAEDQVLFADGELMDQLAAVAPKLSTVERCVHMGDGPDACSRTWPITMSWWPPPTRWRTCCRSTRMPRSACVTPRGRRGIRRA
jgi:acyl-CoA synthetase (AMP-forming)/AMP-acid ligase II